SASRPRCRRPSPPCWRPGRWPWPRATGGRRSAPPPPPPAHAPTARPPCPCTTNAATATPSSASMAPDPRIAVCPGSYDPVTNGHVDIISRASAVFDEVIVAVVNASVRKTQPLFDAEERIGFIERATAHLDNVTIEPFATLVVDLARDRGARAIIKGLRAISDFEYELEMNQLNRLQ